LKILLTGAEGFTGRVFARMAAAAGHDVVALSCDLTDATAVAAQVDSLRPEAVVHLAAIAFVAHNDPTALYAVNVVGTMNLLDALCRLPQRPRRVLVASSANVYGNCENSPIAESTPPAPVNHYAASKLAMEHMAMTCADRLPLVIVRPFNYTGPGQAVQFLIPKLVDHFVRRAPVIELGNLHVEREYNDVRMVCDAYLRLLQADSVGGIFNVCSGRTYSIHQVLGLLTNITGHQIEVRINPVYARANEVDRLCGDPDHLVNCIGSFCHYSLTGTLQSMLQVEGRNESD
jgi:GDP-6-deoxy-D-talose 4-dehydrogenase